MLREIYIKAAEQGDAEAQYQIGEIYYYRGDVPEDKKEAIKWYRKAAEQGHANAQYDIGFIYDEGVGVVIYDGRREIEGFTRDNTEAVKWYRKAAEQGDAEAQNRLGDMYGHGWGVPENKEEAVKWYKKAAEQGNERALKRLDEMYRDSKIVPQDDADDVNKYRKAAEQGDADAQIWLGEMYRNGKKVPKDDVEAAKWYRKAADQGNTYAQSWLGWMYDSGKGVPLDYIEAMKWYRKAAEQGDAYAQNNIGVMYDNGKGVPQNDAEAAKWYHKAAEQGYANALNNLTAMCNRGNSFAQFYLGWMYNNGKGVPQDYTEAVKWYRKAAEQGDSDAQYNLGVKYANGKGVPQDYTEAVKWYRKAAEQENSYAQNNLGLMYETGKGVPQDKAEAVKWYRKAAEQGNSLAQFNLGEMYREGKGISLDYTEAVKWYRKAAEQGNVDAQKKLDQMKAKGIKVDKDKSKPLLEQNTTVPKSDSENKKPRKNDSRLRDAKECKALLDACTPYLYKQNIFRISGIHIDASPRDLKRRFDDLKTAAEMGDLKDELNHAFALNPIPNIDQIREAAQRFQDPEKRIVDEFFWFWPLDWGKSDNDPALDALKNCDPEKAIHIWSNALPGDNLPQCTIAKHNLAVLHHLKAIDLEIKALDHDLPAETLNAISKDWHTCFKWWKDLVDDEELWSFVADRIRTIDDQRLTTGFARRLCATLPEAMDKINAMLAINFAEKGKLSQATNHISYMKETHQGKYDVSKTLSIITKPLKTRVESAVEIATSAAKKDPAKAAKAAFELLQFVSEPINIIQTVLPPDDHKRIDICDHVAEACLTCQIAYDRKTDDFKTSLEILDAALKYATSEETKEHISDERSKIVINKHIISLRKKVDEIENLNLLIANKMNLINNDLLPYLSKIKNSPDMSAGLYEKCADYVAGYLRGLSVTEYNDHSNLNGALAIIDIAISVAKGIEERKRLQEDKAKLLSFQNEAVKHNLYMKIRTDEIEITKQFVRYNSQKIAVPMIQGIKYGIYIVRNQYGTKTTTSYLIEITDDLSSIGVPANALLQQCVSSIIGSHRIKIECNRFLRKEAQVDEDFNRILDALFHQVFPDLVQQLAENIISGNSLQVGFCRLTNRGIYITTGALMWKKETLVPFSDLKFYGKSGHVIVSSIKDPQMNASLSIRDVWNAAILEFITKAVEKRKK
jgi:TPR repeat protein